MSFDLDNMASGRQASDCVACTLRCRLETRTSSLHWPQCRCLSCFRCFLRLSAPIISSLSTEATSPKFSHLECIMQDRYDVNVSMPVPPVRAQRTSSFRDMRGCVTDSIHVFPTDHAHIPLGRDGHATITTTFYRPPNAVPLTVNLPDRRMGALRQPGDGRRRGENYLDLDGDGRPPPPYHPVGQTSREVSPRPIPSQAASRDASRAPPPPPPSSAGGSPFASSRGRAGTPRPGGRRAGVNLAEQATRRPSQGNEPMRQGRALDWGALNIRPPVRVSASPAPSRPSRNARAGIFSQQGPGSSSSATQGVANPMTAMVLHGHDFSRPIPRSRPASQGPPSGRPGHSSSASSSSSGPGARTVASTNAQPPSVSNVRPDARTRANLAANAADRRRREQQNQPS